MESRVPSACPNGRSTAIIEGVYGKEMGALTTGFVSVRRSATSNDRLVRTEILASGLL
jgi:hypothetical protein